MNRNEKKIENSIIKALNIVCETLKDKQNGFIWLTHFVDYEKFPGSLKIVFVFDTNQHLVDAKNYNLFKNIFELTGSQLKQESVHIKRIENTVFFDTEENGADFDNVSWGRKYH